MTSVPCLPRVLPRIHARLTFLDCFVIVRVFKSDSWRTHTVLIAGCVFWIRKQIICAAQAATRGGGREIPLLVTSASFNFIWKFCFLTAFIK